MHFFLLKSIRFKQIYQAFLNWNTKNIIQAKKLKLEHLISEADFIAREYLVPLT